MKDHKGIVVAGFPCAESAMAFNDCHKDELEKLGYYLMVVGSDEIYVKLLSIENLAETDLKELLNQLDK